jgi:hypothetical protein
MVMGLVAAGLIVAGFVAVGVVVARWVAASQEDAIAAPTRPA